MTEVRKKPGPKPKLYKTRPVSVRVTENEHRKLVILARRMDVTVGEILRVYGVNKAVGLFDRNEKEVVG